MAAVQTALAAPPQASLQTTPPLLFASAEAGDHAYLEAVGLINEHRYAQAIDSLERARASFGAHPDILTYLGFANRKLHHYDVAEHYYRASARGGAAAQGRDRILWRADGRARQICGRQGDARAARQHVHLRLRRGR